MAIAEGYTQTVHVFNIAEHATDGWVLSNQQGCYVALCSISPLTIDRIYQYCPHNIPLAIGMALPWHNFHLKRYVPLMAAILYCCCSVQKLLLCQVRWHVKMTLHSCMCHSLRRKVSIAHIMM